MGIPSVRGYLWFSSLLSQKENQCEMAIKSLDKRNARVLGHPLKSLYCLILSKPAHLNCILDSHMSRIGLPVTFLRQFPLPSHRSVVLIALDLGPRRRRPTNQPTCRKIKTKTIKRPLYPYWLHQFYGSSLD